MGYFNYEYFPSLEEIKDFVNRHIDFITPISIVKEGEECYILCYVQQ